MITPETLLKIKQEIGENSLIYIAKLKSNMTTESFIMAQTMRNEMSVALLEQAKFQILHQLYNNTKGIMKGDKE